MIVLALSATPIAGIVCGLNCESLAHSQAPAVTTCHTHTSASPAAAVGAVHVCDHDISSAPFLVQTQELRPASLAAQSVLAQVCETSRIRVVIPVVPSTYSNSPPRSGGLSGLSSTSVLRI